MQTIGYQGIRVLFKFTQKAWIAKALIIQFFSVMNIVEPLFINFVQHEYNMFNTYLNKK